MNKKTLFVIALAFLAVAVLPVFAQTPTELNGCYIKHNVGVAGCPSSGFCDYSTTNSPCGMCCLLNSVYTITDWVFIFLMALSALMIVIGAIKFTTAGGNPDNTKEGRNYIMYAAIGIAIALFARAIPSIVKLMMGVQQ
jgi:hypothetical protein